MSGLRQEFVDAMSLAAATVNVVTTDGPAGRFGVTVSAMSSVSADGPDPVLLVCINASCSCVAPILTNDVFCLNILNNSQRSIADTFAGRTGAVGDGRFGGASWIRAVTGAPMLEDALAVFDCTLLRSVAVGTHHVLFGSVKHVRMTGSGPPLVYVDRRYAVLQAVG